MKEYAIQVRIGYRWEFETGIQHDLRFLKKLLGDLRRKYTLLKYRIVSRDVPDWEEEKEREGEE